MSSLFKLSWVSFNIKTHKSQIFRYNLLHYKMSSELSVNELFTDHKKDDTKGKEIETLKKLLNDHVHGVSGNQNSAVLSDDQNVDSVRKEILYLFGLLIKSEKSLLKVVECLSFALTDSNVEKRAKGMVLLAEFIHQCLPGSMNNMELDTLMTFFCDRLKGHHSIQPLVIYGFLGLVSYQNLTDDLIIDLLQAIFAEVHVQSLVQADRRNVFNIFSNLLKTKIHVLKTFSTDFVLGFIQAMDSERDPRNLVICFENSLVVIRELDFSLFVEDLFEVLSCYFPVEFREPKDNEFRIKKEDLVNSLRKCLTSTHIFGPYAIPLYLEKLSSEMLDSKLDSLVTFTACLEIYQPQDVSLFIDDIWLQIRKDFLLSDITELSSSYKEFIYNLVKCLSKHEDDESLMKMLDFLIKDCLQTLKDPEMAIAASCSDIILQASNASQKVYEKIIDKLIPPIQTALEKYTALVQRTCLLDMICKILSVENSMEIAPTPLVHFVNHVLPLLQSLFVDSEDIKLQILCLQCMKNMICKSTWFRECDFYILAQHVLSRVLHTKLNSQLLEAYESFVRTLSLVFPATLKKGFLEVLEVNIGKADNQILSQCLQLLEFCCENDELRKDVYSYFNTFVLITSKENPQCCENVLHCYITILKKSESSIDANFFVLPILNLLISADLSEELLSKVSIVLSESFNFLESTERRILYSFIYDVITSNFHVTSNLFGCTNPLQMRRDSPYFSVLMKSVFTQLTCSEIFDLDVERLCEELARLANENINDPTILEYVGVCYASVINKLDKDSLIVEKHLNTISDSLATKSISNAHVVLLSWMTKALVLNWQKSTSMAIELLLACLNNEAFGNLAAIGFHVIVKNIEGALNKESKAVIKLMYKQRFAQYALPLLINNYHNGGDSVKSFHMAAISNTLPAIPKQMLQNHLKSLLPLLMHSLATSEEILVTESTLSTILSVLDQNKDVVMEYVPSLVSRLLLLTLHQKMSIRILSLKSLAVLSSYTPHVVQPLRNEILRKLRIVLDDKKRLVRKEAMKCSNAWHLMS